MLPADLQQLHDSLSGLSLDYHAELDSTNDRAQELVRTGQAQGPTLVWTDKQSAGRGRGANVWWSTEGAVTFSLLFPAATIAPQSHWPVLSLATGLAICETLDEMLPGAAVGLKWPNDVFLKNKKVCGVLIETISGSQSWMIIGIGINVNNSFREAPADLRQSATSLADEFGRTFDRVSVLRGILRHWQRRQAQVEKERSDLASGWQRYCILSGRIVRVDHSGRHWMGRCLLIDEEGGLLLQQESEIERIVAGTVRIVDEGC